MTCIIIHFSGPAPDEHKKSAEETMNKISVIIPVYNRAAMVKEAVESVIGQTRPADEILVIDDGSTDDSAEGVMGMERVVVIHQPNRGISAARNTGLNRAQGNLIAFLDSDDLWHRDKLLLQERFLDNHPELPLCHTQEIWILNNKRINQKKYHKKEGGRIFIRSLERCLISPSSAMIRQGLFSEIGVFDESMTVCEDYDLWLRITAKYEVGFLETPLITKRGGHPDQLSKKYPVMDRFRINAIEKVIHTEGLDPKYKEAAIEMFLYKANIIYNGLNKRGKTGASNDLLKRIQAMKELI